MLTTDKLYQSILSKLSVAPIEVLRQIDTYLKKYTATKTDRIKNKQKTLALAGGWSDMSDKDIAEFLEIAKKSSHEAFSREIDF